MSVRIMFMKQIHSHFSSASSTDRYVRRELTLPFGPFYGLTIRCGDFAETIALPDEDHSTELTYNVETQTFTIWSEDKTIYLQALNRQPQTPIEDIVAGYLESGWELEPKP